MEVKLCTHVYLSVSMTTINKKWPQAVFLITTSSLLKLAHHKMDGGKAWYTCVLQGFHDDDMKEMASGSSLHDYPFTSQTHIHHLTHGGETWYTVFPWKQ